MKQYAENEVFRSDLFPAIVGSVAYRIIIAIAIKTNLFPTYFLKLVSVIIIAIALGIGPVRAAFAAKRNKTRRQKANA